MSISVSGLVSGLNTTSIISQLQAVEQQPIIALQKQEAAYQVELSSYSTLQGNLTDLQSAVTNLASKDNVTSSSATSSNTSLLTATATTATTAGSYSITVNTLAAAQKLNSTGFTGTEAVGAGTIHLKVGSNTATDITVGSTDTISTVAQSINNANAGVTANVVYSGASYYLMLTSQKTGTANTISLTVTESGTTSSTDPLNQDTTGLSRLVYDSTSKIYNLTQQQAAADANISVDGITNITRSSNTISDVISGVTLNLQGANTSTPVTLTVQQDYTLLNTRVNAFVTAYNSLVDTLNTQQSYDSSTHTAGTLFGDSTTSMIQSQITKTALNAVSGLASGFSTLADMGVTQSTPDDPTKLSKLQFNSATLSSKLSSNPTAVATFFTSTSTTSTTGTTTGTQGFSATMSGVLNNILNSTSGLLATRTKGIQSILTSMDKEISDMTTRLNANQTRLQTQFSALEVILSNYKNTASSLTTQLSQLQSNWASSSSSK